MKNTEKTQKIINKKKYFKLLNVFPNMKKLNVVLFFMIFCFRALAQNTDTSYSFSIKQAVDFAMQNQKEVVNAQIDAEISRYKVRETVGMGLPQINASFDLKDYEKIPTQFIPDFISPSVYQILYDENLVGQKKDASGQLFPVQFGAKWNATAGITASQLIFEPSYLIGVQASRAFKELSEKNLERTKIETAVTITKAYYLVLLLKEREKVVEANTQRLQKLLNDTKALFENGFVEKIDFDRIQVANNNIQTEAANFKRLIEMSEKSLKFQIGLPYNTILTLTDSLNIEEVKNIQETTDIVDPTKRIEFSILKTQERLQQYNVKRYKSQYIPSLIAYGSLSTSAQRTKFDIFESNRRWFPTGVIGATLSFNLFDGTQRESRIRQEKLTLKKINNEVSNFENAINLDVSSSRSALLDAISALNMQDKNLELATSVSRTAKLKYDQGVGSNLEVLDAETSLKESQVNYFNALYNSLLAKIDLDKALGKFNY